MRARRINNDPLTKSAPAQVRLLTNGRSQRPARSYESQFKTNGALDLAEFAFDHVVFSGTIAARGSPIRHAVGTGAVRSLLVHLLRQRMARLLQLLSQAANASDILAILRRL